MHKSENYQINKKGEHGVHSPTKPFVVFNNFFLFDEMEVHFRDSEDHPRFLWGESILSRPREALQKARDLQRAQQLSHYIV
jgi:hypothetical protein